MFVDRSDCERDAARLIWDYHHMNHPLRPSDCILVLGSHDTRVAEHAVDLFQQGLAPWIVFSGGLGRLTDGVFEKSEAETFADIAVARGVQPEKIIVENQSTNTGENVAFVRKLLAGRGLCFDSFIVVQKPYMERRTYATFKKVWPEKDFIVSSPPIPFEHYPNGEITEDDVINIMVGDLQRIMIYPARGFQIPQEIPAEVGSAFEQLVEAGYTDHLIKE